MAHYPGQKLIPRFLGAHCSAAGGLHEAVRRIMELGGTALQLFTRNQRQWAAPPLTLEHRQAFAVAWQQWGAYPIIAHDSYLTNLASPDEAQRERSIESFALELGRCEALDINLLVTHPGAHKGQGVEAGIATYVAALDQALDASGTDTVSVLLETTAGQGTSLGRSFEELAAIIDASRHLERLGVCLDTCHVFAAGYDLRTEAACEQVLDELGAVVGLERLGCVHLNDSKHPLGSGKDRHEHIGQGELGLAPFRTLLADARLQDTPMVIETPKDKAGEWDVMNLGVLREMIP